MRARALLILGLAGALQLGASTAWAQRLLVVNCDDGELRSWPGWVRVDTMTSSAFLALTDAQLRTYAAVEISHCIDGELRTLEARRKVAHAVREGVSLYVTAFGLDLPFVPGSVTPSGTDACEDAIVVPPSAATHPVVTYPTPDLTGADLSNVGCAAHGSFSASSGYETIAVASTSGDAVMLAGTFSCGRVFIRSHQFAANTELRAQRFIDSVAHFLTGAPAGMGLDTDLDGIDNVCDNCPSASNVSQTDCNGNGVGDACDPGTFDADHDGVADACDTCPLTANPDQPFDTDEDGIDDLCDDCLSIPNPSQADCDQNGVGDACDVDNDGDRVPNSCDDCPDEFNPLQRDSDHDGVGDACQIVHGFFDDRASQDVTLSNLEPDANQINLHSLMVFRGSSGTEKDSVLWFDLSSIPSTAKVTRGFLEVFQTVKVEGWINLHVALQAWSDTETSWSTFGGAYDPHVYDTRFSAAVDSDQRIRFTATEPLRDWISGVRPNHGFLLRAAGINITRFGSRRRLQYERRPYVFVDYTVPDPAEILLVAEGPESAGGLIHTVNVGTGAIAPFGRIGRGVRGLATAPDGRIYATAMGAGGVGELLAISPRTGVGSTVGPLIGARRVFGPMPDCTFTREHLYCWSELDDQPAIIDVETGEVNLLGGGVWAWGPGFAADRDGTLWLAPHGPRGALYTVDPRTGRSRVATTLRGSLQTITAMTFIDGTLYAIESSDTASQLVRIDVVSGSVARIVGLPRNVSSIATFGWSP